MIGGMRGNLSLSEEMSGYPSTMPVSDFHAKLHSTVVPTENVCGAGGPIPSRPLTGKTSPVQQPSGDEGCAQGGSEKLKEKAVLTPPMFIFKKKPASMKRRAERCEENSVVGISSNKRVRSVTYPNLNTRNRKDSCDSSRRVRSGSFSFPPPPPVSRSNVFMPSNVCSWNKISPNTVSPINRVRRSVLQPARLLGPQARNVSSQSHQSEMTHDHSDDICSVKTDRSSITSIFHPKTPPQVYRLKGEGSTSDSVRFVFGENMSERVLVSLGNVQSSSTERSVPQQRPQKSPSSEDSDCSSSDSEASTFESSHEGAVWSSLRESAAAYTASCVGQHVLRLRQVQVFTGEEEESNVVQLSCRLFVLEKRTQSWIERGRGVLRLNDLASGTKGGLQSRIVMRHQGSLKVILNTKLWPHTQLRRPARRNLQVTATDMETQAVRVFLIQGSARDIARLYVAIHHRLVALRASAAGREVEVAVSRARAGHCNSDDEEEEDEEERKQQEQEEGLLVTRLRPVVCDWVHSKPSLDSW